VKSPPAKKVKGLPIFTFWNAHITFSYCDTRVIPARHHGNIFESKNQVGRFWHRATPLGSSLEGPLFWEGSMLQNNAMNWFSSIIELKEVPKPEILSPNPCTHRQTKVGKWFFSQGKYNFSLKKFFVQSLVESNWYLVLFWSHILNWCCIISNFFNGTFV